MKTTLTQIQYLKPTMSVQVGGYHKHAGNEELYFQWLYKACSSSYSFFVDWIKSNNQTSAGVEKALPPSFFKRRKKWLKKIIQQK